MNVETKITLTKFQPRWYQNIILDAWENEGYKKILYALPRRCLSGKTHILMANGSYKLLSDIKVGDKILSWDGEKLVADKVINKWSTGVKETKKVRSINSLPIISSDDHVFAATQQGQKSITFTPLRDITPRRQFLNYAGIPFGQIHNPDLAEFYGYLLADGYVVGYQQPKFTGINDAILRRVEALAHALFNCTVIWREKGKGFDLGLSNGTKGGGTFHNPIKELFRKDKLDVAKPHKRLPPILWDMDEESIGRYFAGLISSDGSIYCGKSPSLWAYEREMTGHEVAISCGSSSELCWDIYWLVRKMGIMPQEPKLERGSNWKVRIAKGLDIKKLLSFGPIYGKEEKQREILELVATTTKKHRVTDGFFRTKCRIAPSLPEELYDIETKKNHNFIANGYLVHNSGKDFLAWNIAIRQCIKKPCLVLYALPTYSQARKCIFEAICIDSTKFIDYIPKNCIENINQSEMKIRFTNGSILRLIGAESYDTSLVGTNAQMIIFSEAALMPIDKIFAYARPIVAANGGTILIYGTPRGKNAFWQLYQTALTLPDWHVTKMGVAETQHVDPEILAEERLQMSDEMYAQEWETSFEKGVDGQIYGRELDKARLEERIGFYPHNPQLLTHLAIDIGVKDATTILWFQVSNDYGNGTINIIDSYSNTNMGIDHYAQVMQSKPYRMGKYFAPHDLAVREWGGGAVTRYEKARELGVDFEILEQVDVQDGIDNVKLNFPRIYIHAPLCKTFINALENYHREYDEARAVYKPKPVHTWASNFCDALRYLCMALHKTQRGMSADEFNRKRATSLYGNPGILAQIMGDDGRYRR